MASRNNGCVCRVPVHEIAVPTGLYDRDALAFLASRGIDVVPNHRGELSVAVADAQALWDEHAQRAAAEVDEQARLRSAVAEANRERLVVQEKTYTEQLRASQGSPSATHKAALKGAFAAVASYDKKLPRAVRDRLDALPIAITRKF